ncbi:hypothetical protein T12_7970 [Trichinella patagoniensis]|uniref:Uncharacterized protein n=1 Tax=Trichinella patagoniensis TaxID=990121 RepID=A0A0V1A1B3_9BILA|nr:hypothetical protein T12_7970 [Trichinella patagoniensis]
MCLAELLVHWAKDGYTADVEACNCWKNRLRSAAQWQLAFTHFSGLSIKGQKQHGSLLHNRRPTVQARKIAVSCALLLQVVLTQESLIRPTTQLVHRMQLISTINFSH